MKPKPELVDVANENFLASFRKVVEHSPGGEIRSHGGPLAFVSGLPLSLFNGCVVVEPATSRELDSTISWIEERDVPYRVWIAQELVTGLEAVPRAHGLDPAPLPYPGMVLHPLPDGVPPLPVGVDVVAVAGSGLGEFLCVCDEGGLSRDLARRLFSESFAGDPEVELFVGRLQGRPVGTSIAIRSSQAAGVYNVGTLTAARRRGVGTALTWAAVEAGRAWGRDTIVLQSSEMGLPMYRSMGFRAVAPYITFGRQLQGTGDG